MISKKARLVERSLGSIRFKNIAAKMMLKPRRKEKNEVPPKSFLRNHDIQIRNISGMKCVSVKLSKIPEKHILYFHGGAYTLQANRTHWSIIDFILKEVQCAITFINYPLVPESSCANTINMVTQAYEYLCNTPAEEIVLIGDSAGGGLALALAQNIKAKNISPRPSKIVLFSPWLDVSIQTDVSKAQAQRDLILDKETLEIIGERYSGELSTKDPLCSPIFGDLTDIGEIALFTGTSDILNNQALMLKDKMLENKGALIYHEYEKMQHVWMSIPIPEAKDALMKACAFIIEN